MILNIVGHYTNKSTYSLTSPNHADGVASLFFEIFPDASPRKYSDRPNLRAKYASLSRLGLDAGLTTAYHPQANQVERKPKVTSTCANCH